MIEIFILSIVQGITEFLPISSSSHLIIISEFKSFDNKSLSLDVSMHIGSFIAVLVYFHKDILNFMENRALFLKIFLSSIPVVFVGFILLKTNLIEDLRNLKVIGWMTLIFGILLYLSDKFKMEKDIKNDYNFKSALIIGCFQTLSLFPGVSRSGITITSARLLNFKRVDAAKISFLLSLPTLGAISIYGLNDIISRNDIFFRLRILLPLRYPFYFQYLP